MEEGYVHENGGHALGVVDSHRFVLEESAYRGDLGFSLTRNSRYALYQMVGDDDHQGSVGNGEDGGYHGDGGEDDREKYGECHCSA